MSFVKIATNNAINQKSQIYENLTKNKVPIIHKINNKDVNFKVKVNQITKPTIRKMRLFVLIRFSFFAKKPKNLFLYSCKSDFFSNSNTI